MAVNILAVEDDQALFASLQEVLERENYLCDNARGEKEALAAMDHKAYDLLLLDVGLAEGNAFTICRKAKENSIPVIFLTASNDENVLIRSMDMDADDFIRKPFKVRELLSRMRNVLRRYEGRSPVITIGSLRIDTDKAEVTRDGNSISLSALEYRILCCFLNNRGKMLSRDYLLEEIWDLAGDFVNDNTLTVYIKRLREKIEEDPSDPQIIKTVRGLGYRMD